jgi:hypothetical protein
MFMLECLAKWTYNDNNFWEFCMMKKWVILLFLLSLLASAPAFAISVVAGQGYGTFRLSGAGATSMASVMSVGVQFNKYIEIKYMSLDTSIRMPVMPFRLYDMKYSGYTDAAGSEHYVYYDSDVVGLSLTLPIADVFGWSVLYGFGRARVSNITQAVGAVDPTATLHRGPVHVFNTDVHMDIPWGRVLLITPHAGAIMHFLDKDAGYKNAMSWYATVSISYIFNGQGKDEGEKEK